MEKTNSICPVITELERIYDAIAKINKLKAKRPIITIQTKGRKNTLGWHWKDKWQRGKKVITEINVCAENLNKNPIETLIHEMIHYHNTVENITDCNQHQYHNKHFKQRAESYGLNVKKDGRHGWAITSISKELQKILDKLKIKKESFKLYRKSTYIITSQTKMLKYRCNCTTVRCATDLNAQCNICNNQFRRI